jgi:hypothetical protein
MPPCAQLLWADSTGFLYRPAMLKMVKTLASLFLLTGVLLKSRKYTNTYFHCPISVFIFMASKLEAVLEIRRCGLKLVKRGVGDGGGLSSAPPSTCLVSRYSGLPQAMRTGWYPFHCPTSVSFSFSTFLCLAASWRGLIKNIRTISAEQLYRCSPQIVRIFFYQPPSSCCKTEKGGEGERYTGRTVEGYHPARIARGNLLYLFARQVEGGVVESPPSPPPPPQHPHPF